MIYGEEDVDESKYEIGYESGKIETKQKKKADDGKRSSGPDALQADRRHALALGFGGAGKHLKKNQGTRPGKKNAGEFQVR